MKIPVWILSLAVTAMLGLQAWTLQQIVDLKVSDSALTARVDNLANLAYEKIDANSAAQVANAAGADSFHGHPVPGVLH